MEALSSTRGRRLRTGDYDQKVEQRVTSHQCLRNRNNVTTCRSPGRQSDVERRRGELQRKRQEDFLKRRDIGDAETPSVPQGALSKEPKVALRTNPRWAPPLNRRSLVTAQDLGITWPNVHSTAQAQWTTPLASRWSENRIGRQSVTSPAPLIYPPRREAALLETMGKTDRGVQTASRPTQDTSAQTVSGLITVKESDLFKLADYLQEALWREGCLKKKLSLLQGHASSLLLTSEQLWVGRRDEGLMHSKIGALETQLQVCSQKLSRDGVKRLVLQMEEQRLTYEEKAQEALHRALTEKAEATEKAESLQGALQAARAESAQWQGLYEELKETSCQMRSNQEQSTDLLHQLQTRLETAGGQEVRLRDQLGALERDGAQLRNRMAFLEEDNQAKGEQLQELRERRWCFEDSSLTENFFQSPSHEMQLSVSAEGLASVPRPRGGSDLQGALRSREKECVELRAELEAMEHECQVCQSRLTQCREELRQLSARRSKRRCSSWLGLVLLLVVVLAVVALVCVYHPPFTHSLQDFYADLQQHVEQYLQERASPGHSGCYRPI